MMSRRWPDGCLPATACLSEQTIRKLCLWGQEHSCASLTSDADLHRPPTSSRSSDSYYKKPSTLPIGVCIQVFPPPFLFMSSQQYPVYAPQPQYDHVRSSSSIHLTSKLNNSDSDDPRIGLLRTPSPTQQEYNALHGIKEKKSLKQKIQLYGIIAILLTLTILLSVFHEKIINALKPFTDWMRDHKIGPLIPILLLIVLSFPPLFGHEIVAMLAGVTWGLAEAFLIVAVGTLLGEIANFFVFKNACSARGAKMEQKDISYGLLGYVVRKGGFLVVLVVRFSAIPPHFATAVFSTVGISFAIFVGAAILSLPKALVPVYIGWALRPENEGNTTSAKVEKIVLGISIVITVVAYIWINRKLKAAREEYIYSRRKARQGKIEGGGGSVSRPDVF
ncbi:hypothetical protein C8F01DRAFT_29684 [Mycena amicta]|nr:hypothetical protein C8F01DRAFT_29684 [Mycena amicta]